ncbi:ZNF91 protein, partial [Origma solitaria]|nr:ZNF91 protein [Origma solitaria]
CQESSCSFSWSSGLAVDEPSHARKKPFKCLERGKSFSWSSSLIHHQMIHTEEWT